MTGPGTISLDADAAGVRGSAPMRSGAAHLLTADEVAAMLGVTKGWVYSRSREWVASDGRRGIPTVPLGRYFRYRPEAIAEWAARLERGEVEA
jgi:predicted DNA-binding transcriptional regulator AlpA